MDPQHRVVRFLSSPAAYPHPAGRVARRETHVSHVFLAGPFAYKLKKAVKFPFLDASTLQRRKRFCQLELTLNRRLAPATYLGIVPVTDTSRGLRLGGAGRVVDWVVKMRRLPDQRMLDRLIAARAVSRREMERLAGRLILFFARAGRGRAIDQFGAPARVAQLLLGNLQECQPFVGTLFSESDRRFLEVSYRQWLALYGPLLARRVKDRRMIDGHGDLRCENICLPARQAGMTDVVVFDCVEFQPAFRCGDLVNDLSFLLMDLEFRGRRDLAAVLEARYRRVVKDATAAAVLPVYKCHRSLVRGKVRGLAWRQHPHTPEGRRIRALARRHFQLAARYARQFAKPRLIVVGGLIGSGKSTLARGLAKSFGAVWLRTDEIRLTEFARARRANQGFSQGIYAPHISELVYQRLMGRAEAHLRRGLTVVCDGTFSKAAGRETLRQLARRQRASFHFIECAVPRAVALRRIAKRYAARADISEAKPEHYDRLKAGFEPVRGWPARDWTRLSDHRPADRTHQAALAALRRAWVRR